ncbi:hypothetical protein CDAR_18271 [Caerostris darwini]|uniref:Uncharacterized protein n=1 Tax=Caerostris darwini TaxID=1538125 RepID=A0AAV4V9Z8_9ARAC|nr:hypothetical protein CDAR_18271 [Caerostris darwini]
MIPKRTGGGQDKKEQEEGGWGARQRGGSNISRQLIGIAVLVGTKGTAVFGYMYTYTYAPPPMPLLILFFLPSRLGIGFRRLLCRDYVFTV